MKLKSIAVAGLLALGAATAAQAVTAPLGTLTPSIVSSGALSFSAGLINDNYTFTLSDDSLVQSNVTIIAGSAAISPAFYGVYTAGLNNIVGDSDDVAVIGTSHSFSTTSTTYVDTLSAGTYYFKVFALASGPNAYSISAAATAVPVPEPETYALLGAGLGIVGFVASRRRRQD